MAARRDPRDLLSFRQLNRVRGARAAAVVYFIHFSTFFPLPLFSFPLAANTRDKTSATATSGATGHRRAGPPPARWGRASSDIQRGNPNEASSGRKRVSQNKLAGLPRGPGAAWRPALPCASRSCRFASRGGLLRVFPSPVQLPSRPCPPALTLSPRRWRRRGPGWS